MKELEMRRHKKNGGALAASEWKVLVTLSGLPCQRPQRAPSDHAFTEKEDMCTAVSHSCCTASKLFKSFGTLVYFPVYGEQLNPPHHQGSVFQKDFSQQVIGR